MTQKRKYRQKKRAEDTARTRLKITEAAVELHGTIGPARTTTSAVAERAGVQRRTVYRHFPTDADLFQACSGHFFEMNPWPDPGPWRRISDPKRRLETALEELFSYYEGTESMFSNVLRDADLVEPLRPTLVPMQSVLADTAEILMAGWGARGRRKRTLAAAISHAIDFHTWRSLTNGTEVTRAEAIELIVALVEAAAGSGRRVDRGAFAGA